jgi:hypothetical protein
MQRSQSQRLEIRVYELNDLFIPSEGYLPLLLAGQMSKTTDIFPAARDVVEIPGLGPTIPEATLLNAKPCRTGIERPCNINSLMCLTTLTLRAKLSPSTIRKRVPSHVFRGRGSLGPRGALAGSHGGKESKNCQALLPQLMDLLSQNS